MNKQISILLSVFIILFALIGSLVKTTEVAPANARMIVDHSHNVYVSPPCFNEADVSNFLEEVTMKDALDMGYRPDSSCTEESLIGESRSLISLLFETVGLRKGKWDRDGEWQ
ncbi:hypothetical protein [Alkalihalobacterium chitinilyticum]|uniref:SLH domain-containing protein n=1 Tax=Alkalihalobacterium chitinilyticum TaxID=2980103 RepID=A0ABT5VBR6_9BACI|nr:hypothetical protein [Alkalihalobacterium chitinilyticum]MDE5412152.1 hypothetical protein [Alkalihalobacterium chitinilyticum]